VGAGRCLVGCGGKEGCCVVPRSVSNGAERSWAQRERGDQGQGPGQEQGGGKVVSRTGAGWGEGPGAWAGSWVIGPKTLCIGGVKL
jgi:hypothetical protein